MIHLTLIQKFAAWRPHDTVLSAPGARMSWLTFQLETEKKIAFLLNHYGNAMPLQASYIARNRIDLMPWLAALSTLGIPVTGLDYTLPVAALHAMNCAIGSELVLVGSATVSPCTDLSMLAQENAMLLDLDSLTAPLIAPVQPDGCDMLERIAAANLPQRPWRAVGFTSGTSSPPKSVLRDTPFDQRRFAWFTARYQFSSTDRFLAVMPLYHAAGNGWARLFLTLGASVHIADYDSGANLAAMLLAERISASVMAPFMLSNLLDALHDAATPALPALRWLLIGGKHATPALKLAALDRLGPCLYEYYGTTETGVNTIAEPDDLRTHPDSVGRAYDGNEILIVDPAGEPVGPLQSGTVAIDSYMNMRGYGEASAAEIEYRGRRYLLTPELGYLDADKRLYLQSRNAGTGGRQAIYQLEDRIRTLPNVADVAILPATHGPGLACAVHLQRPCPDESRLLERVRDLAAAASVTFAACAVLAAIPYSPSGKVRVADIARLMYP